MQRGEFPPILILGNSDRGVGCLRGVDVQQSFTRGGIDAAQIGVQKGPKRKAGIKLDPGLPRLARSVRRAAHLSLKPFSSLTERRCFRPFMYPSRSSRLTFRAL